MKKLRLNPEELRVEAFSTTGNGARNRGTVRGHDYTVLDMCLTDPSTQPWECPVSVYVGCHSVSGPVACICLPNETDLSCALPC